MGGKHNLSRHFTAGILIEKELEPNPCLRFRPAIDAALSDYPSHMNW